MLLEICVDTPAGLAAAIAGGADRIELCAALDTGGLTPTMGLMSAAAESGVPTRALIRPRPGDFCYDAAECRVMMRDIDAARSAGLVGVVIGATKQGRLDRDVLQRLSDRAAGMEIALHRAVDLVGDRLAAVDHAVALGMRTILTSGGASTALAGLEEIAAMHRHAAGRIEIMAGSGVGPHNVAAILDRTGIAAVHASCGRPTAHVDAQVDALGFITGDRRETDQATVAALRQAMARRGGRVGSYPDPDRH